MDIDWVSFVSRWLHILFAVTAGGGAIFMKLALHPAAETLADEPKRQLKEAVRARWSKVVMISITLLLATGLFNFLTINSRYALKGTAYHGVFGIKFMLAMMIFFLASVLTGRSEMAKKMRADAGKWLSVLVGMIVVLLALSSFLKTIPHVEKAPPQPAVSGADS